MSLHYTLRPLIHFLLPGIIVLLLVFCSGAPSVAVEPICPGGTNPDPNVLWCEDFEWTAEAPSHFPRSEWIEHGWIGNNACPECDYPKSGVYCNWTGLVNGGSVQTAKRFDGLCAAGYVMGPGSGDAGGGWSKHCISPEYGGGNGRGAPIYARFYIYWSTNFKFHPIGGKMFYFFHQVPTCSGSNFDYRIHFATSGSSGRPFHDGRSTYNCSGGLHQNLGDLFEVSPNNRGVWHLVEVMVRNSTPNVADGELKIWVNGALKMSHVNVKTRCNFTGGFNIVWLDAHQGGAPDPSYVYPEQAVWYDNVVVSRAPIGPLGASRPLPPDNVSVR